MIEFIDAISKHLDEIFDGEYPVYLESVEQGLKVPCFFINPIYSSDRNMISNRKYRLYDFDIIFIPDEDKTPKDTLVKIADTLFGSFDQLEVEEGVVIPSFERRIDIVDDILHFKVVFQYYYYTEKPKEPIQDTLEGGVIVDGQKKE